MADKIIRLSEGLPITHEDAVLDNNGTTIGSKVRQLQNDVADKVVEADKVQQILEDIKGSGDVPAATVAQVAENTAKLSELEGEVYSKITIIENAEYTYIPTTSISGNAVNNSNANYRASSPIKLNSGDKIECSLVCNSANAISLTNAEGTEYSNLVSGNSAAEMTYTYTATRDCYVAICWRQATAAPSFVRIHKEALSSNIETLLHNVEGLEKRTDDLSYKVDGFDGNKMADLSNVATSGHIDSLGNPQANSSWVRGTIPVVADASAIVFKNVPTISYYTSAYNYWVNALGERVGSTISCSQTMGLEDAELPIPSGAVSMMVSLPSSVSLASLDISFKVNKDGIMTRLEDAETAIGNQSAETNRLREELVATELSGVVTSSYDWVADVVFPSGITIKNGGSVDLNLYMVKSFSSSDYVTIRVGEKVVLPYEIVAVRSTSQKGDYKLIRYGETNILDDKIEDANAKIDSLASVTALKASVSALANGETLSIANAPQCIKIGDCISFYAKISSFGDGFTIGKASGYYGSGYIDITPTSCIFKEYSTSESVKATINHGLVFEEFVKVVIKMDGTKWDLVLQTLKGTFVHSFDSSNTRSVTRVTSNGASLTDLELKYTNETINKSIWAFGDSYFSINSTSRQFYYLNEWGFLNFMVNGFPGASSGQMSDEIDRCLAIAKPKYIIWCLGMNDNGAITQNWQPTLNKVKGLCAKYNITLILSTIPIAKNSTYKHKDEMNAVVVNSGYRYVDVAKAVGSNADGEWFGYGTAYDYCSSDGVHPSTIGAKAIATQFLVDVPELMA